MINRNLWCLTQEIMIVTGISCFHFQKGKVPLTCTQHSKMITRSLWRLVSYTGRCSCAESAARTFATIPEGENLNQFEWDFCFILYVSILYYIESFSCLVNCHFQEVKRIANMLVEKISRSTVKGKWRRDRPWRKWIATVRID